MSGPLTGDSTQTAGGKFASLGPMLLARKGSAKPAMRAQLDAGSRCVVSDLADFSTDPIDQLSAAQDDLGWNDMGDDMGEDTDAQAASPDAALQPDVKRQQELLVNRIADANLAALQAVPAPVAASPVRRKPRAAARAKDAAAADGRRAAFTLRLDGDRHLRLRLASTIEGESAQNLVTRALDEFLARLPEIETLAAQVRRPATKA